MKKPLLSIVMTVFNNEKYFPIAVENIQNQTYENWELVIVDDGSTDNTGLIADEFAKKDSRIKVIHQDNQWIYAALNNGIKYANGDYIFVHNSDDVMVEGALEILATRIFQYNPDVIWVPVIYHKCDCEQNIVEYDFAHVEGLIDKEYVCESKIDVEKNWLRFWTLCLSDNQVNCYRADIMKANPFHTDMFCGDAIFNIEIADFINKAVVLNRPLYVCYRYCDNNSMNASFGKWYPNEHNMYNYMYEGFMELDRKWKRNDTKYIEYWMNWRINILSMEFERLANLCNVMSPEDKVKYILEICVDPIIKEIATETGRKNEIKRRIIAGIKKSNGEFSISEKEVEL